MKKAALLTGIPGTGKSTIARKVLNAYPTQQIKDSTLVCHVGENFTVMGDYSDPNEIFPGTDRLSMSVSPVFQDYVKKHQPEFFLEGDRLVGNGTIDFLIAEGYDVKIWCLSVPASVIQERYVQRGSNQDPKFLKSKATKVSNIRSRFDLEDNIIEVDHITPEDTKKIAAQIIEFLLPD